MRTRPRSSRTTRSQVAVIEPSWWLTRTTVPACARSSAIRASLRRANAASPTASASSTSRTGEVRAAAMAKRRRVDVPEE